MAWLEKFCFVIIASVSRSLKISSFLSLVRIEFARIQRIPCGRRGRGAREMAEVVRQEEKARYELVAECILEKDSGKHVCLQVPN